MNPPASTLAGCLDDYLILRRALGCKLIRAERYLRQFLDYLGERELDTLTVEAAADWVSQSRHGSAAPGLGMEAVRGFAVFLHAHDPAHEVPPPGLFPRRRVRAVPTCSRPPTSPRCRPRPPGCGARCAPRPTPSSSGCWQSPG